MLLFLLVPFLHLAAQVQKSPCTTNPVYRQFDFWIGEWDVYALNGKKAGDSKIELILDSCIILENWKSMNGNYAGKSFNTFNATTGQWQQTWVDNMGGSTEYLEGKSENNSIIFQTNPFAKDTVATRRLTFYKLSADKVRQHGEVTKDNGASWKTEYDLEYRRKKE
ncbi:MAG: DUF1579 domain-containing protein [Chitinophagaceae bacterium]|nr:MAG: DUF1579 domain-containing protein [Chitinophagaceae bacterium]